MQICSIVCSWGCLSCRQANSSPTEKASALDLTAVFEDCCAFQRRRVSAHLATWTNLIKFASSCRLFCGIYVLYILRLFLRMVELRFALLLHHGLQSLKTRPETDRKMGLKPSHDPVRTESLEFWWFSYVFFRSLLDQPGEDAGGLVLDLLHSCHYFPCRIPALFSRHSVLSWSGSGLHRKLSDGHCQTKGPGGQETF